MPDQALNGEGEIQTLPLLPIKNSVLFPHVLMPFSVARPVSVAAVEAAVNSEGKEIVLVAQRDASQEEPGQDDLYAIGTKAIIKKIIRGEGEVMEVRLLGVERNVVIKLEEAEPFLKVRIRLFPVMQEKNPEIEALHRELLDLTGKAFSLARPEAPIELDQLVGSTENPLRLVYLLGSLLSLELEKEQTLLEAPNITEALRLMYAYLSHEAQVLGLRKEIASQAQTEMTREQREYLLRQQLRAIQQELGEKNTEQAEVELLRERMTNAKLPDEVNKEVKRELGRLERLNTASPEYNVIRTYLELVLELPWEKSSDDVLEIFRVRQILDEDHYDLKEVKERIVEHLGVLKLNPQAKAPILCFVGPPGVGKTSLGQSVARALERQFERMSLGGIHDEAELRGHRRTYIGAMPGRIIQSIRRADVNNPVLMLDEVDKLGRDFRGDPAAALLEVLDPEQNRSFRDNYVDLPFDLSRVFFITTANTLDSIPRPLLDRLEVLRLPGYSEEEKQEIAKRYLILRRLSETGLTQDQCRITDETLRRVISHYTREAGVRQLERTIGKLTRKVALSFAEGKTQPVTIEPKDLGNLLGPEPFFLEQARKEMPARVVTGLAWTETGGAVLFIEATLLPEGSDLTLTGHLGEVMRESAKAAQSYVWAHADLLGIEIAQFKKAGLHIHVPAGATPKDGPSAGITIVVALASLYTHRPARSDTAITGEITLSGLVLPVGGVKEKVLAARRAGIYRVVLPKENQKDLHDLPEHVREQMEFIVVERVEEVLAAAIPDLALLTT